MENGQSAAVVPLNKFAVVIDETTPRITLGGQEFPIPSLAVKQLRIVVPGLMRLAPLLNRFAEMSAKLQAAKASGETVDFMAMLSDIKVSTEEIDDLSTTIHAACTRAQPGFSRGEYDNMDVSLMEMVTALGTIAQQTNMMAKGGASPKGEAQPPAGEGLTST